MSKNTVAKIAVMVMVAVMLGATIMPYVVLAGELGIGSTSR